MKDTLALEAIRKRRSIRKYKQEQIGDDELRAIIETGRCAPSGGNSQTCHFIVIQNRRVRMRRVCFRSIRAISVRGSAV